MDHPALLLLLGAVLGMVMGMLGGGGAVLAVPLLVHVVGTDLRTATATSLLVVLVGATTGLLAHRGDGLVRWRAGLTFGLLGVAGAAIGTLVGQRLPEVVILVLFAGLAAIAGLSMLRPGQEGEGAERRSQRSGRRAPWYLLVLLASALGLVTGLLGVGGGFLVVPTLVLALGFGVHEAAATGLVVLAVNAASAQLARLGAGLDSPIPWLVLAGVVVGAVVGVRLGRRVPERPLRRGFGVLLLAVAAYVALEALA